MSNEIDYPAITPGTSVIINGQEYGVEDYPDMSLVHLLVLIREGVSTDFQKKSNAAAEIKEVIIPSLPDTIIYSNRNNKYICRLDAESFSNLVAELVTIFYERKYCKLIKIENRNTEQQEELNNCLVMIKSFKQDLNESPESPQAIEPLEQPQAFAEAADLDRQLQELLEHKKKISQSGQNQE